MQSEKDFHSKNRGGKNLINNHSPFRMGISCDSLTIYDDLYKTYLWGICIILNLFVALTAAPESIYDIINMAAICLYMNYSYFHQNQLKHRIIAYFAKEMYEMHLIKHTIDELSRWVKGYSFIRSYLRSCIRWTYVFLLRPPTI